MTSKSVVVELQGGLGNQLFGWAAGYTLSKKLNCDLILDKSNLYQRGYQLDSFMFGLTTKTIKKSRILPSQIRNTFQRNIFTERSFEYDKRFSELNRPYILKGYFQSWKYHDAFAREIYSHVSSLATESQQLTNLRSEYKFNQLVAVHVRRGDYTSLEDYHGTINSKYYLDALSHLKTIEGKAQNFVVFSDEPDKAKEIVPGAISYIGPTELHSSAENMVLMSQCKSLIGANSSFSLWAGMLMQSESQIRIFPKPWFTNKEIRDKDLVPTSFIRLEKN